MTKERVYGGEKGNAVLRLIGGDTWQTGVAPLAQVSTDMARITVDFAYGEVLSPPGLELLTRQCCTIAMLLANGSATAQLEFHLHGLLNVGGTVSDAVELITIGAALAGFPSAIGAVPVLRKVLDARHLVCAPREQAAGDRWARGVAAMAQLAGCAPERYTDAFRELAPEFADLTVCFEFGEVLGRDGLTDERRHLVAIALIAALGNRAELLSLHLGGALSRGVGKGLIEEVLIQLAVYAGFPAALSAFAVLRAVEPSGPAAPAADRSARCGPVQDRRERGLSTLEASSGGSGQAVVRSFEDVAPAIGGMIVDHAYGEIFADRRLDPKVRELTAIAALSSTMAEVDVAPLGVHIDAAIALGSTREEIVQVIVNVAPYSGYPAVQKALAVASERLRRGR